ncbi:MAG: ABC transporter permease [Opitutales bacterium]|nr:ABC transporter permease [Opitutales bacterium]
MAGSRDITATILPSAVDPASCELRVCLAGTWTLADGLGDLSAIESAAKSVPAQKRIDRLTFSCDELGEGDSSLICLIVKMATWARERNVKFDVAALPERVLKLYDLATTGTRYVAAEREERSAGIFYKIGRWAENSAGDFFKALDFLGETFVATGRFFRGKARMRWRDCLYFIQDAGLEALPIITLISFITGVILAFIGAMQLQRFGATIYVANGIALAMVREMGVVMAGVIMCGRTGAAYAAQIGSMQASEEISALRVLGVSPVEYLVLPRLLALSLMLPLLTIYADAIGIAGGLFVTGTMGITVDQFWTQVMATLNVRHLASGLIKSVFFGWLVAWSGCYRGMRAGKSALDVGSAATSAAVLGMVLLCIADGIFAVVYNALNF